MFIGIILGLALILGLISVFGGVVKKVLEVISFIAKLCVGGVVAMLVQQLFHFEFESGWGQVLYLIIGAFVVFGLMALLASFFRLVGYSINFFINSFILLIVGSILKDSLDIAFWMYALALLLFPRIMWISDRFATTTDYDHSEYNFWSNITTDFYTVKDVDWWENDADSWRLLPLQIIFSVIFYLIGSLTLLAVCPIESGWLQGLYLVLATAVNILFDIFVTRNIEEAID